MGLLEDYTAELRRLGYSESTISVYPKSFRQFLEYFRGRDYRHIPYKDIIKFLTYLVDEKSIGGSAQNTMINAIKFYYEIILHQPRKTYNINRPRRKPQEIILLEDDEIEKLFSTCLSSNGEKKLKHYCIIGLLYGCGLRISEIINLKISNINSKRMLVFIYEAKGGKCRTVPLPEKLLLKLREYYKEENPKEYLFNGQNNAPRYTASSIRQFLKKYAKIAGLEKRIYPHLLRHNFTTEHIENKTNILQLQEMLGHNSPKTTSKYNHFRRDAYNGIKSPLDKKKY